MSYLRHYQKKMKVYQSINSLCYGDAIGNSIQCINKLLQENGYNAGVITLSVDERITMDNIYIYGKDDIPIEENDVIIHHVAGASPLHEIISSIPCKKIMVYRNITPPSFFELYSASAAAHRSQGLDQVRAMNGKFDQYITMSEFSKNDLIKMGFDNNKISVLQVFAPMDDFENTPDPTVIEKYTDGKTNIVFIGRIAPNKKQENIIRAYAYYKKHINPDSRLILVGRGQDEYYNRLVDYVEQLELTEDVIFGGRVTFAEILAFYRCAHVFLCMSEHEGFCVPLMEAMYFHIPIIAYNACAVPETLGGSGVLLDDTSPVLIGKTIHKLVEDNDFRNKVIQGQDERLKQLDHSIVSNQYLQYFQDFFERIKA